ncbi:MAG: glycine oxidase ThiO [Nitrosomonas sp.]|nr:glycine oxidase ThiO [Nitrosomonas sp.]
MKQDAVIVGAGVIGLATALKLLESGAKVSILERGRTGMESSWAGGGILSPICPWDYTDAVTRLVRYSTGLFPDWVIALQKATGIDPEYHQCGMCILPPFDKEHAIAWCTTNEITIRRQTLSIPFPVTGNQNTVSSHQNDVEAIILPGIAQIRNPRLLKALHRRVTQLGGQIVENCCVHDWNIRKNTMLSVQSSCGVFEADSYIIAAGAWSRLVLGKYAMNLNIQPVKGQMLLFKFDVPPLSMIFVRDNLYLIPRKDGHLLLGSTLENTGFNKRTTVSVRKRLLDQAQFILPQLRDRPIIRQWSGLRPGSPLNIPTIGRHPELTNLYLNSGHFRYGVTMAPASAEILVNEITGSMQRLDVSPYQSGWSQCDASSTHPIL